jgi:hypothetical protein
MMVADTMVEKGVAAVYFCCWQRLVGTLRSHCSLYPIDVSCLPAWVPAVIWPGVWFSRGAIGGGGCGA